MWTEGPREVDMKGPESRVPPRTKGTPPPPPPPAHTPPLFARTQMHDASKQCRNELHFQVNNETVPVDTAVQMTATACLSNLAAATSEGRPVYPAASAPVNRQCPRPQPLPD